MLKETISELIIRVQTCGMTTGQKLAYLADVFKDHHDESVSESAFNALHELIKTR